MLGADVVELTYFPAIVDLQGQSLQDAPDVLVMGEPRPIVTIFKASNDLLIALHCLG